MTGTKWIRELLFIFAVASPFLFTGLGSIDLLDPDEGMYGAIAREMAEGGDWITPHFNGVRYLEKPPLYFWLTASITAIFGPSEWAVRLGSALPALGTAVLTWEIGRLLYGGAAGLFSAIIFLTGAGVFRYARVAATDFLLVFSITLAIYGFIKSALVVNRESLIVNSAWVKGLGGTFHFSLFTVYVVLFWLGMALGVLSKGLIGLVLPLLIVGVFIAANSKWRIANGGEGGLFTIYYSLFANPVGILLFLLIVLPWHFLAAWENPGFFEFYILDNQILRFLNSRSFIEDDVPVTTFTFLLLVPIWFFPWSLFLPAAWRQGFPRMASGDFQVERLRLLVGLWALVVLIFFSLSSSKLEHYFLPAVPPLSLMVGGLWGEAVSRHSSMVNGYRSLEGANGQWLVTMRRWLGLGAAGCAVVGLALIFFSSYLTPQALLAGLAELNVYYRILSAQGSPFPFASISPFVHLLQGLGAVLLLGLPLAFLLFRLHMPKASFAALLCVAGVIAALVFRLLLVIEPHHSAKAVALALKAQAHPGDAIVHEGPLEYTAGLPFYTGRPISLLNGKRGDLDFGSRYEEARHLFLDREQFARLWTGRKRVFLVTRYQKQESVLRHLPEGKIFLIGQFGSRWLYTNQ